MNALLIAALRYAKLGWAVLPVSPRAKSPLLKEWQHMATTDAASIKRWWEQQPSANIGIHCGRSALAVVDVDPRNGGEDTLRRLEDVNGPFWEHECLEARTPSGGRHFIFSSSEGAKLPGKLGEGIDFLHGNRYFLVAPSLGAGGKAYSWQGGTDPLTGIEALPSLPIWLADSVPPARVVHSADVWANVVTHAPDTEDERQRVAAACKFINPDCSREEYLRVLMALSSTGWGDWRQLAKVWASGTLHERAATKFDERSFRSDVQSLRPDGGVTLATLYHLAQRHGFDPRRTSKTFDTFGDISNAARFAETFRGRFLHVHAKDKWLAFDGYRWVWCDTGEELAAAREIANASLDEAHKALKREQTDVTRMNYAQALAVHRNARRLHALLSLAAAETGMSIAHPGMLDPDPLLLGVRNGVVDLRTGTLVVPTAEMLINRCAGASFNADATAPRWIEFLNAVFQGDQSVIGYVQRAIGYALTGLIDEEKLFFLLGNGANGKSVFANVLREVFGEYAVTVRAAMLARDHKGNGTEAERDKARLPGARLVLINEVGINDIFDDQRVKELVSRERISARPLYGEPFDFQPTHTIFIRGNHQPVAMDTSDGFWRRICLIRFDRHFTESEQVPDLDRKLEEERDGILAWAINGCLHWQKTGLNAPQSIRQHTEQYRAESDQLGEWLDTRCTIEDHCEAASRDLYEDYAAYLRSMGMRPPSAPSFGRQLSKRGFSTKRTAKSRMFSGLRLREDVVWPGS